MLTLRNPVLAWRERHGFSRLRFARICGLSISSLQAIDAGARCVLPDRLRAAVVAVDGEAAWLQLAEGYTAWRANGMAELRETATV